MKKKLIIAGIIIVAILITGVIIKDSNKYNGEYYKQEGEYLAKLIVTSDRASLQLFLLGESIYIKTVKEPYEEEKRIYSDPKEKRLSGYKVEIDGSVIKIDNFGEGTLVKTKDGLLIKNVVGKNKINDTLFDNSGEYFFEKR